MTNKHGRKVTKENKFVRHCHSWLIDFSLTASPYLIRLHTHSCLYPILETQNSREAAIHEYFFSFWIWRTTPCILLHVIIKRTWKFLHTYLYIVSYISLHQWRFVLWLKIVMLSTSCRSEKAGKQIEIRSMKQEKGWQIKCQLTLCRKFA